MTTIGYQTPRETLIGLNFLRSFAPKTKFNNSIYQLKVRSNQTSSHKKTNSFKQTKS
jgi:hypothetical protein